MGLFSDSSTNPGSLLINIGSISDTLLSTTLTNIALSLATPYALAANTRYWVGLSSTSDRDPLWSWSQDQTALGVANEYLANQTGTHSNIGGAYQMRISSSVPEPSAIALMGLGLLGFVATRRKLKK